jgi:hypothetical protein
MRPCQRLQLAAHLALPKPLVGRIAVDDRYGFRVGRDAQETLEQEAEVVNDGDDGVVLGQIGCPDTPLLHRGEQHRRGGEQVLPVALDEARRRCTNDDNQVRRLLAIQPTQILDERLFRILIDRTGRDQGVLLHVERPWRLPIELRAHVLCIFIPWPEFAADGMKDHDALVFFRSRGTNRAKKQ